MGNCQNSYCGDVATFCMTQDGPNLPPDYPPLPEKPAQEEDAVQRNLGAIVRLQAIWRGNAARDRVKRMSLSKGISSRYFTNEEANETIRRSKAFDLQQARVKKKHSYKSGSSYDGEWRGGFRDGHGTQKWVDGAQYEGSWRFNKAEGKGRFTHADGDVYEGDWVYNQASGFGVYTHSNGAVYEGQWKDDLQHGKGFEHWPDGSEYDGYYRMGKKHGYGFYKWDDGSQFEGDWVENEISGTGIYTWRDNRTYEGEWRKNKMEGFGVYSWKDGRKYEGQYKDDKKHGFGVYKWADGRKYEGSWALGKQHGLGRYLVPADGVERYGLWENGKRIKWLDEQTVQDIIDEEINWHAYFTHSDSAKYASKESSFNKPKGFDARLAQIAEKIEKKDKN